MNNCRNYKCNNYIGPVSNCQYLHYIPLDVRQRCVTVRASNSDHFETVVLQLLLERQGEKNRRRVIATGVHVYYNFPGFFQCRTIFRANYVFTIYCLL